MTRNKKLIIYKLALIGLALLFMFYPGIADKQPQIDSRVMITSIGLDSKEDKVVLTAALSIASGSSGTGKETTASADGDNIGEALSNLGRALGKNVGLSHCGMVALGKEFCEKGVEKEISYLVTSGLISDGASVIAADGKAQELIDTAAGLSENAAFSLGSFLSFATENAQIPMISLVRFASNNNSVGKGAYLPIIKMGPGGDQSGGSQGGGGNSQSSGNSNSESSAGQSGGQGEQGGQGESGGQKSQGGEGEAQIVSSEKTMIFRDFKSIGEFDEKDTLAITWQDPRSDRGLIELKSFDFDGENLGDFTFRMKKKGIKTKAKFDGERPIVTVCIDAQLETEDNHRISVKQKEGFTEKQIMDAMRSQLCSQFDSQIKNGWEKAKELRADPFKYGYRLYKFDPNNYERIFGDEDAIFEKLELETQINLLII